MVARERLSESPEARALAPRFDVVALVASAGGLEALSAMLRPLPPVFPAAVIAALHMGGSGSSLAEILSRRSRLPVKWLRAGEKLEAASVYVCPPRKMVEVHPDGSCTLHELEGGAAAAPFDALFESLADSYGARAIGVVLTGMGRDGAKGVAALRRAGGVVIAQSEDSAEQPSMPRAAIAAGVDVVLPLHEIPGVLADVVAGGRLPRPGSELDMIRGTFGEAGQVAALALEIDWSRHPLGPVREWPTQLRELLRLLVESPDPAHLVWGEQQFTFLNDASIPTLGERWKSVFGRSYPDAMAELPEAARMHERVLRGERLRLREKLFPYERDSRWQDAWFDVSFTPIHGSDGVVLGAYATWYERTREVLAARRLQTINRLAAAAPASTARDALSRALALLHDGADVPFAAAYLVDANGIGATLAGATGVEEGATLAPRRLRLAPGSAWPLHEVLGSREPLVIGDLAARFRGHLVGRGQLAPECAVLHPLRDGAEGKVAAVLILGTHPRLPLDDLYRAFLALAGETVNAKLAEAFARQRERERLERLAELDRAKTEFFSNVSHEFRTPLTLMLAPLEELQRRRAELPNHLGGEMEAAASNARRLLGLVNTLLDFSLAEAGRLNAHFEPVDLAALTADIAAVFRSAAQRGGLELRVDAPPLDEPVWVDRGMWEKIVSNLLSNALKFTLEGSITVELRALTRHAELVVRDTGVGIPAADLAHIFKRFHRVRAPRARTHEGAGIGLALVHELVRRHHGRVRAQSREGEGTIITVWLPLGPRPAADPPRGSATGLGAPIAAALAEEAERWAREPPLPEAVVADALGEPKQAVLHAPGARVLVADDNADMREYLKRLLSASWAVETVADGEAALARVRDMKPDLVLADVMMPKVDGFTLLKRIREDETLRETPVLLVTAHAGEEAAIEGLLAGADDYIAKPFSARELVARVAAQLELSRTRRKTEAILQARNAELRGQREALEAAVNGEPLETSLAPLVRIATHALGEGTRAAFYLASGDGTSLHHVVGMSQEYAQAVVPFKIGPESLARGPAALADERVLTGDVMSDPLWEPWRSVAARFNYRGYWSFPIHSSAGKFVGTLIIYSREPREAKQPDLDLAALLTRTASLIISRRNEAEARTRAEQALRESERRMARELADARQLQEVSSMLIEEGASEIYRKLIEAAMQLTRSDAASLQLLDAETGELRLLAWKGFHADSAAYWQRVSTESAMSCGAALREGRRILVPDVHDRPCQEGEETLYHYRLSGLVAVQSTPLVSRDGRTVGMISTHWRQRHEPSERDLALFDVLARQAADVLERTHAQQALREPQR